MGAQINTMSGLFCCCSCPSSPETEDSERQPLLQPTTQDPEKLKSARQSRPAHNASSAQGRSGRLVARRTGVAEVDRRLGDAAETFNEQQERFEAMTQRIATARRAYGCHHDDSLSLTECVKRIRDANEGRYAVTLQMKGYDFCLSAVALGSETAVEASLPAPLRLAQEELRGVSQGAKAIVAAGTKLQELIGWLLSSEERMVEQVRQAAPTYQEQRRLEENLKETMQEVRRAKELSLGYRRQAGEVLSEVAQIAGASP